MYTFVTILIIAVCLLLILIVLIQDPKGSGLSSTFGASNQLMGVRRTADFVEKATWTLAIALLVLSLGINFFIPRSGGEETKREELRIEEQIENATVPTFQEPPAESETQE